MANAAQASRPQQAQQPPRAKRVRQACEYCRKKRLKCTAEQRPCLNCQLYNAECISSESPARKRVRRAIAKPPDDASAGSSAASLVDNGQRQPTHSSTSPNDGQDLPTHHNVGPPRPGASPFPSPSTLPDQPSQNLSGLFGSEHDELNRPTPAEQQHFDQITRDMGIGFSLDFWNLDDFLEADETPNLDVEAAFLTPNTSTVTEDATNALHHPALFRTDGNLDGTCGAAGKVSGIERLRPVHSDVSGGIATPVPPSRGIASGLFIRKDGGNCNFIGMNSTGATLTLCLRESIESRHGLSLQDPLAFLIDMGPLMDEIPFVQPPNADACGLPPQPFAVECVDAFFRQQYASYPIVDRATVYDHLTRLYVQDRHNLNCLERSALFLLIAIGSLELPSAASTELASHVQNLCQQAWNAVSFAVAMPCVGSVQVLLLHALYLSQYGKAGMAWTVCGLAVRIAQSVGLHRSTPRDLEFSDDQMRLRTRLWTSAYILDAAVSSSQGRLLACSSIQIDADLLTNAAQFSRVVELPWPLSDIHTWRLDLAQIQHKHCDIFSSQMSIASRIDALAEVDVALVAWKDRLPLECRPEQQIAIDNEQARADMVILHLDYFNLLRAVHWGAVTLGSQRIAKSHHHARLRASESICLSASQAIIHVLNSLAEPAARAYCFRARYDHLLTAMGIIYHDIFRHPSQPFARTNLEYLRSIQVYIDRDLGQRVISPSLRLLLRNMVNSAQQLVEGSETGK